jgi:hypothetical protein
MATRTKENWTYNGWTFPIDHNLVATTCWCGIKLAIPENLYDWMQEDSGRSCYCPAGHKFYFTEGRAARLERELKAEKDRRARAQAAADRHRARADHNEARRVAQKAATTRARKRHAAGVCPACKRTFQNVQRHMESKHPDYDPVKGHHEGA